MTFTSLANTFIQSRINRDKRHATVVNYRTNLNVLRATVPEVNAEMISDDTLDRFIAKRLKAGKSKSSVNQSLRFVRATLRFAMQRRLISEMPVAKFEFLQVRKTDKTLTGDEIIRLLDVAKSEDLRIFHLISLALKTGCRMNELLTRTWADVSEEGLTVGPRGGFETKNGEARTVPLTTSTVEFLKALRASQQYSADTDHILQQEPGKAWSARVFTHSRAIFKKAGIASKRLHSCRHEFVTSLLEKGAPPHIVQALVGHRALVTTMGHYTHARRQAMVDAMKLVE